LLEATRRLLARGLARGHDDSSGEIDGDAVVAQSMLRMAKGFLPLLTHWNIPGASEHEHLAFMLCASIEGTRRPSFAFAAK
jgi:hypothetical protein